MSDTRERNYTTTEAHEATEHIRAHLRTYQGAAYLEPYCAWVNGTWIKVRPFTTVKRSIRHNN